MEGVFFRGIEMWDSEPKRVRFMVVGFIKFEFEKNNDRRLREQRERDTKHTHTEITRERDYNESTSRLLDRPVS